MIRKALSIGLVAATPALSQGLPEGLEGLGGGDGPILQPTTTEGPVLEPTAPAEDLTTASGLRFTGFAELRYAGRLNADPLQGDTLLSEFRAGLDVEAGQNVVWTLGLDLLLDDVVDDGGVIRAGRDAMVLREAHVFFRPAPAVDVRLGRQILTWGTGDQVFINDLFPKDHVSFFAGRDSAFFKAPADALRISAFSDIANLDFVVLAPGQTDAYVTGERLTYTNPGTSQPSTAVAPRDLPDEPEYALRIYRTFGSFEAALYGYAGFWKTPAGQDATGRLTFPRLQVAGGSLRGPVLGGIGSLELGYYDSLDDPAGTDPMVDNSEFRWLIGYEREIAQNTTLGVQYMRTALQDYDAYRAALPAGAVIRPENRDVATLRLTRLMLNQTLTASAFVFHAPQDGDGHLRLSLEYDVTDTWEVGAALNQFYGDAETPFGQFEDASSFGVFARANF